MPKTPAEMTRAELVCEMDAWNKVIDGPKGPGTPSNTARRGAELIYDELAAWEARRALEAMPPKR